jgi:pantetheine-phosphate adenylyltransferase
MIAVYAGSFDPPTNGHLDIIKRAARTFDTLFVGIGVNPAKKTLFTPEERGHMLCELAFGLPNVRVGEFNGLLVDFCKLVKAGVIVRGLRAVSDFDYEMGIAHANSRIDPKIETFFLPTKPEYSFVSSSTVRELARHKADVSFYVDPLVARWLNKKLGDSA